MNERLASYEKINIISISVLIVIIAGLLIMKLNQNNYRTVTIDIQKIVKEELSYTHLESLSDSQIEQKVNEIIAQKKRIIAQYARRNKLIVLSKQVVFSPTPDITHHLLKNNHKQ